MAMVNPKIGKIISRVKLEREDSNTVKESGPRVVMKGRGAKQIKTWQGCICPFSPF